jgi:hypothetical protein
MDFYDVISKDFIDLAGVPAHLQNAVIAEHRVKWRLREILEARDIDEPHDRLFYTTWGQDGGVNYSESLIDLLTRAVLDSERPAIGPHGGLFKVRGQTSQDLHVDVDINLVSDALGVVYDHIKETERAG